MSNKFIESFKKVYDNKEYIEETKDLSSYSDYYDGKTYTRTYYFKYNRVMYAFVINYIEYNIPRLEKNFNNLKMRFVKTGRAGKNYYPRSHYIVDQKLYPNFERFELQTIIKEILSEILIPNSKFNIKNFDFKSTEYGISMFSVLIDSSTDIDEYSIIYDKHVVFINIEDMKTIWHTVLGKTQYINQRLDILVWLYENNIENCIICWEKKCILFEDPEAAIMFSLKFKP